MKHQSFVCTQLNDKTIQFQAIHFSLSHLFALSSIWHIDRTLLSATLTGQSVPGSDGNEGILCISHSSSITEYLVPYPRHLLDEFYPSAGMQLLYSTPLADWV